jgi:transforming growth factor-beta-induced protein
MINLGFPQPLYSASRPNVAGFAYNTSSSSYPLPSKPYGLASSASNFPSSFPPVGSWGNVYTKPTPPIRQPEGVNALIANKDFNTLTTALGSAGLVETLKALEVKTPITVLAPTNEAFAKLDGALLQSLLKPENKAFLQQVLQYHVSGMKFPLAQQSGKIGFDSLLSNNQDDAVISNVNGKISIKNGAQNIKGSKPVVASNRSTIIPVDQVLIPPEFDVNALNADKKSAVSFLSTNKNLGTLFAAVKAADLGGAVADLENAKKPVTILAPSEAAFKKLDPKLLEALLKPENKSALQQILQYHVSATKLKNGAFDSLLETDQTQLARAQNGQTVVVNGRQVIKASNPVETANGSKIITIDEVLIPPGLDVASLLSAPTVYGLPLLM